jgi:adenine-specific DNA glycosylase
LTKQDDPDRIEADLAPIVEPADQVRFCYLLQAHGRAVCLAREPLCDECVLLSLCPFGQSRTAKPQRAARTKQATQGKVTVRKPPAAKTTARPRRAQSGRRTSAPTKSRRTSGTRTDPSRS